MLKGVLHIHSTYSDGEFSLPELRELFERAGCRFACVTDHAEAFDGDTLRRYAEECRTVSDADFQIVAGLEFTCADRMHLLGYGVTALVGSTDPGYVVGHVESHDGIAVIAHPRDESFGWLERADVLPHGVEAWNTKYDGRYAPRPGVFELLARLKRRRPDMTAFYGQDLHWRTQHRGMFTLVDADADRDAILDALRTGRYIGLKDGLELPSSGVVDSALLAEFGRRHERSRSLRRWIRRAKSCADGLGIVVPGAMKAQLRRIL